MFKTKVAESLNKSDMIAVSPETLAGMLNCGRATAVKIGTDAGAKILIGDGRYIKFRLLIST